MDDDDKPASLASPACFLHEVDPAYAGLPDPAAPRDWPQVNRWRKAERDRLIAARLAMPAETRAAFGTSIAEQVLAEIGAAAGLVVSAYWPFRGEPDLRPLLQSLAGSGARTALPVVIAKGQPLEFHAWQPGDPLERGVWNILIPAAHAPVIPDIVLAPVVGYDPACYRLGYGGGFFDRTLAALPRRPRVIGIGYSGARCATIHPQPHDIAMDVIATENGIVRPYASTTRVLT